MRFYVVDDDPNILKILEGVIKKHDLGVVVGLSTRPLEAIEEVKAYKPDIVLVDYLMPEMDGAALVRILEPELPECHFIIISQVSDKGMIGESYEAGIEFFIQKPINIIEVCGVLKSLIEKIEMKRALAQIGGLINKTPVAAPRAGLQDHKNRHEEQMRHILGRLGILGEKGSADILSCACDLIKRGVEYGVSEHINDICKAQGQKPKIMKQRMRRSMQNALRNIANLGIEDYMSDAFVDYSGTFFDFEEVKAEMDLIRSRRESGGRVNVYKFIEALIAVSDYEMTS